MYVIYIIYNYTCIYMIIFYNHVDRKTNTQSRVNYIHSIFLFFFCFLRPNPQHMWKFLGWGRIGPAVASVCHSHSNAESEPHLQAAS